MDKIEQAARARARRQYGSRQIGFKLVIASAFLLLAVSVGFIVWACHSYYRYQRFLEIVEMNLGETAVVTVVTDSGETCRLDPANRYILYTFLVLEDGKRVENADAPLTGRRIAFTSESALGTLEGTVEETENEYVLVTLQSGEDRWRYYFINRADYERYRRAVSPEGWTIANEPIG